jgi:hypothetical protein
MLMPFFMTRDLVKFGGKAVLIIGGGLMFITAQFLALTIGVPLVAYHLLFDELDHDDWPLNAAHKGAKLFLTDVKAGLSKTWNKTE